MKRVQLTLEDFFNLPSAVIYNPLKLKPVRRVSIDSRMLMKGSLFVAIKGENFDGHDFIKQAVKKGASAVMINENKLNQHMNIPVSLITVENTVKSLGDLAKVWRKKLPAKVIAITGSNGKTSAKEMIADLLSEKYSVNKTLANNNNHIGVPLTILSTNEKHQVLVLELGTNHFGEIAYSSTISQPDISLITNIGNSHLEFLKNKQGVLKEKSALFKTTISGGGMVLVNNDDERLKTYSAKIKRKLTYGFSSKADVKGKIKGFTEDAKPKIEIKNKDKKLSIILPLPGENNAKNFLASAAAAFSMGLTSLQIKSGAAKLKVPAKRLNVKKYSNFILVDDTYNANPESMKEAFKLISMMKIYKKKIAVLGDMFELGNKADALHRNLAPVIKKYGIDQVLCIGKKSKLLYEELKKRKIDVRHFMVRRSLAEHLGKLNFSGSVVLVKGSRGMKMEEFVKIIEAKSIE